MLRQQGRLRSAAWMLAAVAAAPQQVQQLQLHWKALAEACTVH
jgi:hypothetical protein